MAGGTGLGLYSLRKRMDSLAHGRCGVDSRADGQRGSEFWFEFEYRPDSVEAPDEDETADASREQGRGVQLETVGIEMVPRHAHSNSSSDSGASAARSICDSGSVRTAHDASTRLDHAAHSAAAVLTAEHMSQPVLTAQSSVSSTVALQPASSSSAPSRRRRSMRQQLRASQSVCGTAEAVSKGSVDMSGADTPTGSNSLRILIGMSTMLLVTSRFRASLLVNPFAYRKFYT
jgi:hypothetical protein